MSVFLWLIVVLAVWKADIKKKGFYEDYIDPHTIQPIKGIFLLLVFMSHFVQYVDLNGVWDAPYFQVRSYLGQLIVVPFLFYSGYGIAESVRRKGNEYVKAMPVHRVLKVLFQFDMAVLAYFIVRIIMGASYQAKKVLLTLLAWEGIGNSYWYIFTILFLYIFTWISYALFKKSKILPLIAMTVLTLLYILVMRQYKDGFWYNTALAYTAGMWFSNYKKSFERVFFGNEKIYYLVCAVIVVLIAKLHAYWNNLAVYEAVSMLFAFLVVLLTAKIKVTNRFLAYCGERLFSLFILQRLPMYVLDHTAIEQYPWVYFLVSVVITFALSYVFDKATAWLWNKLVKRKVSTVPVKQ